MEDGKAICNITHKESQPETSRMESSNWQLTIGETEVNRQLLSKKHSLEESLQSEKAKRMRLEQQVDELKEKFEQQAEVIMNKGPSRKAHLRKPLEECSRQQQYNYKKDIIEAISTACKTEGYNPCCLQLECQQSGQCETFTFSKAQSAGKVNDNVHSSLHVKDKFSVSNDAYHELSTISNLPTLSKVRRLTKTLNTQVLYRLQCFIRRNTAEGIATPSTIRM